MNLLKIFGKSLNQRKLFIVFLTCLFGSFFAMYIYFFYNPTHILYEISFKSSETIELDDFRNEDYIIGIKNDLENKRVQAYADTGKYPYSSFSYVDTLGVSKCMMLKSTDDIYTISIEARYFNTWQQARRFMKKIIEDSINDYDYLLSDGSFTKIDKSTKINESIVSKTDGKKEYMFFLYGSITGLTLSIIIILSLSFILKDRFIDHMEYDNELVYKTPFHKSYWKKASKEMSSVKNIVTISVLFALQLCTKFISLPSGFSNLGIGLAFLVFSIIAMLYGPVVGVVIGAFSDIFGFILKPSGVFFAGYTLSSMISGFVYGLCLYKTKITFLKCFFARMFVNLFVNTILGSLWWWIINNKTISISTYLLTMELPKNLVYLLPQSLMMFLLIKALSKVFLKAEVIDPRIAEDITFF